jgi:hypothetical protein
LRGARSGFNLGALAGDSVSDDDTVDAVASFAGMDRRDASKLVR